MYNKYIEFCIFFESLDIEYTNLTLSIICEKKNVHHQKIVI